MDNPPTAGLKGTATEPWEQVASRLKVGGRTRINHDCGNGAVLQLSRDARGVSAYCYRCGYKAHHAAPHESLKEVIARRREARKITREVVQSVTLPEPREYRPEYWPREMKLWLYQTGLSNRDCAGLGVYWCASIQRAVLPVMCYGMCVYWQARAVDAGQCAKYINPKVDKSRITARYLPAEPDYGVIVLCEDMLSAYKVSLCGYEAWALLGTRLTDHVCMCVLQEGRPVAVWLDPDRPGQRAARRIVSTLAGWLCNVHNIVSERDPKLTPRGEISRLIKTAIAKS